MREGSPCPFPEQPELALGSLLRPFSLASRTRVALPPAIRVRASTSLVAPSLVAQARVAVSGAVGIVARIASRPFSLASRLRLVLPASIRVRASTGILAPQIGSRVRLQLPNSIQVRPSLQTGIPVVRSRLRFVPPYQRIRADLAFDPFEIGSRVRAREAQSIYPQYILDAIESEYFEPVYLATVKNLGLCSTSHDISHGGRTYTGNGLSNMSPVEEGLQLEAHSLSLEIAASDSTLSKLWEQNLNDSSVKLYLSTLGVDGFLEGNPFLIWSGRVVGVHEDADRGTQLIHCESVKTILDKSRDFYFTPESQEERYPGDRFFEFVEELGEKEFDWADIPVRVPGRFTNPEQLSLFTSRG